MLDLNLPNEDGISLCKWLRHVYPNLGIVMLTARVMGSERTEGYQAGADVYLTKPTRPDEILAVIRNLLRRSERTGATLSVDPACWSLNLKSLYITAPDSDVLSLTPKEAIVLTALAQSTTHCTYLELIDKLGGETRRTSFDKVRLEVLISRLRSKLFNFKVHEFEIKTVHGSGYRLSTPLKLKGG
jgi:DNA-binding response OmpR family regulator